MLVAKAARQCIRQKGSSWLATSRTLPVSSRSRLLHWTSVAFCNNAQSTAGCACAAARQSGSSPPAPPRCSGCPWSLPRKQSASPRWPAACKAACMLQQAVLCCGDQLGGPAGPSPCQAYGRLGKCIMSIAIKHRPVLGIVQGWPRLQAEKHRLLWWPSPVLLQP